MVLPFATLPANAAASSKSTFAYIGAMPNPVGVGQTVMLHVGIPDALSTATDGFTGLTVIVTKPDNSTETIGPYKTDSTGGTGVLYTPTQVGTYFLKLTTRNNGTTTPATTSSETRSHPKCSTKKASAHN